MHPFFEPTLAYSPPAYRFPTEILKLPKLPACPLPVMATQSLDGGQVRDEYLTGHTKEW
jgi:hypothetical protein